MSILKRRLLGEEEQHQSSLTCSFIQVLCLFSEPQHLRQIPEVFHRDIMKARLELQEDALERDDESDKEEEPGLIDQYRGTPERKIPSRGRRRAGGRHSQEPQEVMMLRSCPQTSY